MQYARVIEDDDGSRTPAELNEAGDPLPLPAGLGADPATTGMPHSSCRSRSSGRPRAAGLAILGNAAGTVARAYERYFPETRVDGVDLDGELAEVEGRFFGLGGANFQAHTADARPYLRATERRYDSLILDAYRQPYIPFYLTTREFFALARDRLNPGGSIIVNVGHRRAVRNLP